MQSKQDNEIMDLRRRMEAGLLPRVLMYHSPDYYNAFYGPGKQKELEVEVIIKENHPELLKKWIIQEVPNYFLTDGDIGWWTYLGREVFHPNEMENFIVWEMRDMSSAERRSYTELVKAVCNSQADKEYFYANKDRLFRQYIAAMAYPLMLLALGMNYRELPDEQTDPVLRKFTERLGWQINEISEFIIYCFQILPNALNKDPIKVQSNQYEEELPREKTQGEMVDIMAQELANLPRFSAYAKVIDEKDEQDCLYKGKIKTLPLRSEWEGDKRKRRIEISKMDIEGIMTIGSYKIIKKREKIEADIRERQERWLKVEPQPPNIPPPTRF
jgi:hypothetical protein